MISSPDFKNALSQFPSGVVVVHAKDVDSNTLHGVTISAFSSLSLEPKLVLFCLEKGAKIHPLLTSTDRFNISMLSKEQEDVSEAFSGHSDTPYATTTYSRDSHSLPILNEAILTLSCSRFNVLDGGDHSIIIGNVESMTRGTGTSPLLHHKRRYAYLPNTPI